MPAPEGCVAGCPGRSTGHFTVVSVTLTARGRRRRAVLPVGLTPAGGKHRQVRPRSGRQVALGGVDPRDPAAGGQRERPPTGAAPALGPGGARAPLAVRPAPSVPRADR